MREPLSHAASFYKESDIRLLEIAGNLQKTIRNYGPAYAVWDHEFDYVIQEIRDLQASSKEAECYDKKRRNCIDLMDGAFYDFQKARIYAEKKAKERAKG
jgi:ribosome-interacting GTPase 1